MQIEETGAIEDIRTFLGSIVDRNSGRWFRFIAAILKNDADAEDVIQEAVRRVLERNRPLSSREAARMYLGRAIGNAALGLYNVKKRERLRQFPISDHFLPPANPKCPYTYLEEREKTDERELLLGMLHEGLAHLPVKQYEALRLTILESRGLSIREVVTSSGIPYSTLRHRSKEGLRKMRMFLEKSLKERCPKSEQAMT
jgi:RNA polymerase sigma-70 factor, ECF subfamily